MRRHRYIITVWYLVSVRWTMSESAYNLCPQYKMWEIVNWIIVKIEKGYRLHMPRYPCRTREKVRENKRDSKHDEVNKQWRDDVNIEADSSQHEPCNHIREFLLKPLSLNHVAKLCSSSKQDLSQHMNHWREWKETETRDWITRTIIILLWIQSQNYKTFYKVSKVSHILECTYVCTLRLAGFVVLLIKSCMHNV